MAEILSNQHGQSVQYWKQIIPDIQREYEAAVLSGKPVYIYTDLSTHETARTAAQKTGLELETIEQYLRMLQAAATQGEIDLKHYAPRAGFIRTLTDGAAGAARAALPLATLGTIALVSLSAAAFMIAAARMKK